jgi:threonine dehydratase
MGAIMSQQSRSDVTLADIAAAQSRIAPFVRATPLIRSSTLSTQLGTNIYLKLEVLQETGAFKVRGAFNKLLSMTKQDRRRGVVAVSGGNHARAVAYAASWLGINSISLMPQSAPKNSIAATREYGGEVVLLPSSAAAYAEVEHYVAEGMQFIHPFSDPFVIAGQGTAGLEILRDLPEVTDVIVSIGGGGLVGGIATAVKGQKPGVRIWGVETEGAETMTAALKAGRVVTLPAITSVAVTLGAPAVTEMTLMLARRYLEEVIVVSDREAIAAMITLFEREKIVVEPAGSCTVSAAHRLKDRFTPESHVALFLCGGNISLNDLCLLATGVDRDPR